MRVQRLRFQVEAVFTHKVGVCVLDLKIQSAEFQAHRLALGYTIELLADLGFGYYV